MREGPVQSYIPAWKIRLVLRLEEFGSGVLASRVPPGTPSKNLNGIKNDRAPLQAVPDPDFPGRFLLKAPVTRATLDDQIKNYVLSDGSADGLTQVINGIIPRKFDWGQNGVRTADTLTAELRFVDFPIDPRCVRSAAIEFYLGTVTQQDYAQGMLGITRGDVQGAGTPNASEPLNVVPDSYLDENGNRRTNLRFTGWVDKWKMHWSEEEPYVELSCRDNTQLFLNQVHPPRLNVSMKQPIDLAIATYLSNFPQFAGITIEYRGQPGDVVPQLDKILAGTAFRPHLGPPPAQGSGDDVVVWDYLTDIAGSIGHVIRLDGNAIVIQRAATMLSGVASGRADDPYKGRYLPSGDYPNRTFVFGKNVKELEISRDFANKETKNVEVRCWSTKGRLLVARFPTKEARIPTSTPGDSRADNKWTIVRIQGIDDARVLQRIAEDVYHGRNRNEMEVTVKTKNLASFGGGNADPDILDLKAGDAIEILVDRAASGAIASGEVKLSSQEANASYLKKIGYSDDFSRAYAKVYQDAGFQRVFRVRELQVSGDWEDGVDFEIHGLNMIQARGDISPSPTNAPVNQGSQQATQGGGTAQDQSGGANTTDVSQQQATDGGGTTLQAPK